MVYCSCRGTDWLVLCVGDHLFVLCGFTVAGWVGCLFVDFGFGVFCWV